jgi:hypothetical protein
MYSHSVDWCSNPALWNSSHCSREYFLNLQAHNLQARTIYRLTQPTGTHNLQAHTTYRRTQPTGTHNIQAHTTYRRTQPTGTYNIQAHNLQAHITYRHTQHTGTQPTGTQPTGTHNLSLLLWYSTYRKYNHCFWYLRQNAKCWMKGKAWGSCEFEMDSTP